MKKIKCRFLFFYGSGFIERVIVDTIKRMLARSDENIQLEKAGKRTADVSIVDSISNIREAQGIVLFYSNELSVHNPLLMDYSILLTRSSSPRSYQTKRTIRSMESFFNCRAARSSSPHGDPISADTVRLENRQAQTAKTRFCCFVYSHNVAWRDRFVQSLSRRKRVDCPGACLNNMERIGPKAEERLELMSHYKFAIAFENTIYPSYLTEKIFDALRVGAVPIYWGDPEVTRYVNPKAFINVSDFPSSEAAIDHILEVDRNPELYAAYQNAEPFLADSPIHQDTEENLARFFKTVCDQVGKVKPRNSLFMRFYRFLYLFLMRVNYSISTWSCPDGIPFVQGIPMRRLLSNHRILLRIPIVLLKLIVQKMPVINKFLVHRKKQ